MKMLYIGLVLLVTIIPLGCKTTGDPKQGGLFGWDEKKATQRQQALEKQHSVKQSEIAIVVEKHTSLERAKNHNNNSLMEINAALRKLKGEQDSLRDQVAQLHADNLISEDKLRDLVIRYQWLDVDGGKAVNNIVNTKREDFALQIMRDIEQENKSLVNEILLLIGS